MSAPAARLARFPTLVVLATLAWPWLATGAARAATVPEVSIDEAARRLAPGGWALLIRHASTDPGVGDPPGYRLEDCATQRNLSAQGRAEAAALGQALRARGVRVERARSSRWCRSLDTARLAFGEPVPWQPLDSFFDDRSRAAAQTEAVRAEIARIAPPRTVAMVTHQVNIGALTGLYPSTAEAVAVRWRDGALVSEFRFRVPASVVASPAEPKSRP